jgi:hypothetical protein
MSRISVPSSYSEAVKMLGDRPERTIGNNTQLRRQSDGSIALTLHWTDVCRYWSNGDIGLRANGYQTTTTKDRINKALAGRGRVYAQDFAWYYAPAFDWDHPVPFVDGMVICADGSVRTGDREMAGVA